MHEELCFHIQRTRFDEHYEPARGTRLTTNFANLARGASRQENLRRALRMIDSRANDLAHWDNPARDRYAVELDIISVALRLDGAGGHDLFPLIEMLQPALIDKLHDKRIEGVVGNSFSSYVRDYDFSVLLPAYNRDRAEFATPDDFGDLHGKLFKHFVRSSSYRQHFSKPPVICISVSTSQTYQRTSNQHPVLGVEYRPGALSSTDLYFAKMGMQVRLFMPPNGLAPLAFYFQGDLLSDYTNLELIGCIATMETFQKIYRPEIYNANAAAGLIYRPSLQNPDYASTQIVYDRDERSQLAVQQGRYTEQHFIRPHQHWLAQWAAQCAL